MLSAFDDAWERLANNESGATSADTPAGSPAVARCSTDDASAARESFFASLVRDWEAEMPSGLLALCLPRDRGAAADAAASRGALLLKMREAFAEAYVVAGCRVASE